MPNRVTLAYDLGGTQVRAALVNAKAEVLVRTALATDVEGGPTGVLHQFELLRTRLLADWSTEHRHTAADIVAIGVSAPGPLDSREGVILGIPTLPGWDNFPLRATLEARLSLPVVVEGDGIAAANGEWQFGAGRGCNDLVYVTVSTGIGGGVVCDGRLLRGRRGMAGHIGHVCLAGSEFCSSREGSADVPICACGRRGCFEAYAAGSALGRAGQAAARQFPQSALGRRASLAPITAADVVAAARAGDAMAGKGATLSDSTGDPLARELLRREAGYLGAGLVNLLHAYSPSLIVIGGGLSQAFDLLASGIRAVIEKDAMLPFRTVPVVPAALGDNAGLVGVAQLARAGFPSP